MRYIINTVILIGSLAVICLTFGLAPAMAIQVPATAQWVNTGIDVSAGDVLEISASGTWRDGSVTSGPEGSGIQWPDNFLNLQDLGVCNTCATEQTPGWGALIGYIGASPPAPGSYISKAVLPEALKVFYIGANFQGEAPLSGRLWLNKNADAYSGYTVDNSGSVSVTVSVQPGDSSDSFRFVGPTLCVRNLIIASAGGEAALLAALFTSDCLGTLYNGGKQGVALYQYLLTYKSVNVCLLGNGVPKL